MDLKRAGILLEKINKLYDSMRVAPDDISAVEADLMRDYVRRLYDALLDDAPGSSATETPDPVEVIRPTSRPKKKAAPAAPEPETDAEAPASVAEKQTSRSQAHPPAETSRMSSPTPEDDEVEVLFEKPPARELAEKLQELPIQDLRRAMGLNERIFTINELFGGDQNAFDETVDRLNRFASFEQAKAYLIQEVAVPFGWTDPKKKEIAKNFIRLVRRLYADK